MEEIRRRIVPNEVMLGEVKKMIAEGRQVNIKVKGVSMLPFIVGDRDSVLLSQPVDLAVSDIVLGEIEEGRYVLHRIKAMQGDDITMMGDGNLRGTEQCLRKNVVGKVVKIIRNGVGVDPYSPKEKRKVAAWLMLTPIRRYLLAIYRRLPGHRHLLLPTV